MIISDNKKIKVQNYGLYAISANKVVIVKGKTIILADPSDPEIYIHPLAITLQYFEIGSYGEVLLGGTLDNINTTIYSEHLNTSLYLAANGGISSTVSAVTIGSISKLADTGSIYINFIVEPSIKWGDISGDVTDQQDLQDELDARVPYTGANHDVDLGIYKLSADAVEFSLTPTNTPGAGQIAYDGTTGSLSYLMNSSNVVCHIGQQLFAYVKNAESITITKGQPVYLYQASGNKATIKLAYNTSDAGSAKTLGLAAENITSGHNGFVICQGVLSGINTGSYNEGDTLYLGATAGTLTTTKPYAPNHLVYIGVVEKANNGAGQIYVKPQNGYELDELHDVAVGDYLNRDVLYRDTDNNLWRNGSLFDLMGAASDAQDGYLKASDWTIFNDKQNAITLTTTGSSGAATFDGTTLNIPQYSGGSGGVSVYVKNSTTYSSTGTGSQILHSLLIPANTFTTGDVLRVTARFKKVGGNSTSAATIYINNSISLSGGKVIRSNPFAAGTLANGQQGTAVIINNVNLTQLPYTTSNATDISTSTGAWVDSTAIDWTAAQYLIFSCAPASALDTVSLIYYQVEKL